MASAERPIDREERQGLVSPFSSSSAVPVAPESLLLLALALVLDSDLDRPAFTFHFLSCFS